MQEVIVFALALYIGYFVYLYIYFKSEKFRNIKKQIADHIEDCNELNDHLEELKSAYADASVIDYGASELRDASSFNMRRRKWSEETKSERVHNCSAMVCKNANNQPFKYLCKYFNISVEEETLTQFEDVLNKFCAAEQGKNLLIEERDAILGSISNEIPSIVMAFSKSRVTRELGFESVDLSNLHFPTYTFQYVSAGGNSSSRCDITLDIENLDRFVSYLGGLVKIRKSAAGQRALMTSALREKIKSRDNFTCQICSLSTFQEQNLLLEIDHINPIARGGLTTEQNLQTLCWRCNRSKGAKLLPM
jgi:hypothetical protein